MARQELDREDLLAEATALVRRIEWANPEGNAELVAGIRVDGALSVYFAGDRVWHFDAQGRVRRGFVAPYLYRAGPGGRLARLGRSRTSTGHVLLRSEVTPEEQREMLAALRADLGEAGRQLAANELAVGRHEPATQPRQEIAREMAQRIGEIAASELIVAPPVGPR